MTVSQAASTAASVAVCGWWYEHPLVGLLQEHRVADQVGELLEYLGHPGAVEDQFGEPPVGLLGVLERERLLADDLAVKGLGHLDERNLSVKHDQRQVAASASSTTALGTWSIDVWSSITESGDRALGERGDELALGGRTVREPHPGREQQLAAAKDRRHLQPLARMHPADRFFSDPAPASTSGTPSHNGPSRSAAATVISSS